MIWTRFTNIYTSTGRRASEEKYVYVEASRANAERLLFQHFGRVTYSASVCRNLRDATRDERGFDSKGRARQTLDDALEAGEFLGGEKFLIIPKEGISKKEKK